MKKYSKNKILEKWRKLQIDMHKMKYERAKKEITLNQKKKR
jgi:hypothetical protein